VELKKRISMKSRGRKMITNSGRKSEGKREVEEKWA
jgi:hypothetical protein